MPNSMSRDDGKRLDGLTVLPYDVRITLEKAEDGET